MIRIGMIGADSTHTEAWSRLVNLPEGPLYGQAQVVKLWGEDRDQARAKANDCRIPAVVDTPEDALTEVDLAMIVNRYGDDHPRYARHRHRGRPAHLRRQTLRQSDGRRPPAGQPGPTAQLRR